MTLRASSGGGDKPHVLTWPAEVACTLNASFGDKQGLEDQHVNGGGRYLSLPDIAGCLQERDAKGSDSDTKPGHLIPEIGGGFDVAHSLRGEGFDASEDGTGRGTPLVPVAFDTVATLDARAHAGGFPGTDGACGGHVVPVSYAIRTAQTGSNGWGVNMEGVAYTLDSAQPAVAFAIQAGALRTNPNSGPDGVGVQADHAYTLEARAEVQAVAFQSSQSGGRTGETHATLDANNGPRRHNGVVQGMAVRRLTVVECERLMGFPDGYTAIPWRKKPASECPDGPRYRALGNSWAVPVAAWVGKRIQEHIDGRN